MHLETITRKQQNELEQQIRQLLVTLRRTHLHDNPLFVSLQELAQELEQIRHGRFDEANSEYRTY